MRNTTKLERWLFAVATSVLCRSAIAFSGIEPAPFHGASNRAVLQQGNAAVKPHRAVFTLAQPVAAHTRINASHGLAAMATGSTPSQVGIGFEYVLRQSSLCNCGCLADPTCDGVTDILDVVGTVTVAFRAGAASKMLDCQGLERTDADCSGSTDVLDVVKMINVAFRNGDEATEFCDPCP